MELRAIVNEFEIESGIKITGSIWREYPYDTNIKKIGETVKLILNNGIEDHIKDFERYRNVFKQIHNSMEEYSNKLKSST